ncbi:MAG TPA: response regulator [Thermodesulfobacteriota bacterium]|nr:response regulator [Thermodesulfobacteriota bacterium]
MCRTLIVEDNATFRQMLKEILCARFPTMTVEEEPDGSDLFPKIENFHPRIVFMDVRLPGENGLELAKKIKMNYSDITLVILTSYDLPEYREAARQIKADHYLTKDSPTRDFLALVESILLATCPDSDKQQGLC